MDNLINKQVECIILACTELPLAFNEQFYKDVEVINPVNILALDMINEANKIINHPSL